MKLDLKKTTPFKATKHSAIINRSAIRSLAISGYGDPNQAAFSTDIEAMYTLAYEIKMAFKKEMLQFDSVPDRVTDYVVPPLQGYWTISTDAQIKGTWEKSDLVYQLEIVIPDSVPADFITRQMDNIQAIKSSTNPRVRDVTLIELPAQEVAHILHQGPYDDEPESFTKLSDFLTENNYVRTSKNHREIYLSDARRTAPEKLKTILEVAVQSNSAIKTK